MLFSWYQQVLGINAPGDVKTFLETYPGLWALGNTKIFLRSQLVPVIVLSHLFSAPLDIGGI